MSLDTANSVVTIQIPGLFGIAQQLQGFSADDMFSMDDTEESEVVMGADGRMTGGWVPVIKNWNIILQGDSPSLTILDALIAAQRAAKALLPCNFVVRIPGISRSFVLNNCLLGPSTSMMGAKKIGQPRKFTWRVETVSEAPF